MSADVGEAPVGPLTLQTAKCSFREALEGGDNHRPSMQLLTGWVAFDSRCDHDLFCRCAAAPFYPLDCFAHRRGLGRCSYVPRLGSFPANRVSHERGASCTPRGALSTTVSVAAGPVGVVAEGSPGAYRREDDVPGRVVTRDGRGVRDRGTPRRRGRAGGVTGNGPPASGGFRRMMPFRGAADSWPSGGPP